MRPPNTVSQGNSIFWVAGFAAVDGPEPPVPWAVAHPVRSIISTALQPGFMRMLRVQFIPSKVPDIGGIGHPVLELTSP